MIARSRKIVASAKNIYGLTQEIGFTGTTVIKEAFIYGELESSSACSSGSPAVVPWEAQVKP